MTEEFLAELGADALSRLRWRVTERFGLAPDIELSQEAVLWAAANMVLDMRAGVSGGSGDNPAFDPGRFERLKEARA